MSTGYCILFALCSGGEVYNTVTEDGPLQVLVAKVVILQACFWA